MSEFLVCQNCGRRFFGENIECPYCRDAQIAREREANPERHGGHLYRFLFACFQVVLGGIVVVAGLGMRHASLPVRVFLVLEAVAAATLLGGLMRRRQWARQGTIAFIVANACIGLLGFLRRGTLVALAWGPGPLALLLFLVPFCSQQARERYDR